MSWTCRSLNVYFYDDMKYSELIERLDFNQVVNKLEFNVKKVETLFPLSAFTVLDFNFNF